MGVRQPATLKAVAARGGGTGSGTAAAAERGVLQLGLGCTAR